MARRSFSWYSAKPLRFDSSELGIESEVASLTDRGLRDPGPALPSITRRPAALFSASVGLPGRRRTPARTDKRFALAVQLVC